MLSDRIECMGSPELFIRCENVYDLIKVTIQSVFIVINRAYEASLSEEVSFCVFRKLSRWAISSKSKIFFYFDKNYSSIYF